MNNSDFTHRPIKKIFWQRWMDWSGSFLVISVLLHVLLFGCATMLVVQVVQNRKEKMNFTAPPPSPAGMTEHKVKPSKKTSAAAPSISKRITSSAVKVSVALPAMDLNASTGPDVMASVMSGMGASGLGSGSGGGSAGMASMPVAGLTAFGFRGGGGSDGLVGRLYDLKQTKDRQPTDIKDDGFWKNPHQTDGMSGKDSIRLRGATINDPSKYGLLSDSLLNEAKVINSFLAGNWDEKMLLQYYRSKDPMIAYQWSIPMASAKDAVKAFGVENEVKPSHILIHYKGSVSAPRDCTVRFRCMIRGGLVAVRFDENNVIIAGASRMISTKPFDFVNTDPNYDKNKGYGYHGHNLGKWFNIQAGKKYPVEILIVMGVGYFGCGLMIEEKNPTTPYQPSEWQWQSKQGKQYQTGEALKTPFVLFRYPLFVLKKGIPATPFVMPKNFHLPDDAHDGPHYGDPDVASEPMVFSGKK